MHLLKNMQLMKAGVIAVIFAGTVSVAQAASCYRAEEIEADQAVRFQTELMVVSDSCGSQSYTEFTHRNASTLAAYQQKMIGYFRRASGRGADTAFDRFITSLANQMALSAGKETVSVLCTRSADLLTKGQTFDKNDFVHYVTEQAAAAKGTYPACKN
ncbi:MAG TPA: hypothetical protein VHX19_09940 [Stellaceae bacterium]|jgi:hypothetical protein|nr:hypothetical protein [Stellaceae bacterium]